LTSKGKRVILKKEVFDSILDYGRACHPREGILLLRGKVQGGNVVIDEVVVPPFSIRGFRSSGFPLYMLPLDFSIIGIAHSHPSGNLKPSIADLNNFYGEIMVIVAYPYMSSRDIAVYDRQGERLSFELVL